MSRDADDASLIGWEYYRRGEMEQAEQWWSRAAAENDNAAFNLAQRYLDIEQIRFGSRLHVTWELDAQAATARVPPLLLQPLVGSRDKV